MEQFNNLIAEIDGLVWGIPLIVLIMACGILLTVRGRGLQIRHLGKALKFMVSNEEKGEGEISSFGALCTALSATIGTGNIVGVATALAAGGPGALFWMIAAAVFGMATKYTEGFLAIRYRKVDAQGHFLGGPFYYIENGMGEKWKWLAKMFAVCGLLAGLLGIGTITQINGITSAADNFFTSGTALVLGGNEISYAAVITGFVVTLCAALVIIGGIQRISQVSQVVVPFMAVVYIGFALLVVILNITKVPAALVLIFKSAFGLDAVAGGTLGSIMISMQKGVARGIFSNEAGLGSAPIAAAAARTNEPCRQGLVTMCGTFIDTIIVCTMTGLAIVISGAWSNPELEGVEITTAAFQSGLPFPPLVTAFILMLCLVFFAFTTILGWSYYSERCLSYLTGAGKGWTTVYRWLYIAAVFAGPYITVEAVWNIADIFNGLMAIPNIIALIALSGVMAKESHAYFYAPQKK